MNVQFHVMVSDLIVIVISIWTKGNVYCLRCQNSLTMFWNCPQSPQHQKNNATNLGEKKISDTANFFSFYQNIFSQWIYEPNLISIQPEVRFNVNSYSNLYSGPFLFCLNYFNLSCMGNLFLLVGVGNFFVFFVEGTSSIFSAEGYTCEHLL